MAEEQTDAKVSYPYMSSGQWNGARERLRKSVPNIVDVDWVMAALGASEKGAKNTLPQFRAVGLIDNAGKPMDPLVHDLRDDATYAAACQQIVAAVYPEALRDAWNDPDADPDSVAAWFMRNAGTGAATAKMQAKFYLLLLKGELPSAEEAAKKAAKKTASPVKKAAAKRASAVTHLDERPHPTDPRPPSPPENNGLGPNLHIDMQIHISADASDVQIDTVFKSMAKHLYGRE